MLKTTNNGLKTAKNMLVLSNEFLQTFINLFGNIMVRWLKLALCEISPEITMPVDTGWKW